ncbi:hypothetical protein D3C83_05370 [compost metagenome]
MTGLPSASANQRCVGSSSGSPARKRCLRELTSYFFRNAGSCFFSTRAAVGEENITLTLLSATIFHQMPASGRIGNPS